MAVKNWLSHRLGELFTLPSRYAPRGECAESKITLHAASQFLALI